MAISKKIVKEFTKVGAKNHEETTEEKCMVRMAISQCGILHNTEALASLRMLALNPGGIYRDKAIETAVGLGPVDSASSAFVETIMTNRNDFTRVERGIAVGKYAKKLLDHVPVDSGDAQAQEDGVVMLYGHRKYDVAGANMLDTLFAAKISEYQYSSNRLDYARFILSHQECREFNVRKFTSVTNTLMSSGQPLRWINVGGTSE